jgi:hypothetical protein
MLGNKKRTYVPPQDISFPKEDIYLQGEDIFWRRKIYKFGMNI